MDLLVEVLGWAGMALILGAYGLLSAGRIMPDSKFYQYMNVAGAAGFIVNSGVRGAYPSAALNVVWLMISLYALMRRRHSVTQSEIA
ncbi:MAG: hypothetical protein JSR95_08945 [Proteobacteria bacterium]|nr:hypothetical protein [Pseudomonadota bacterium]